MDIDKLIRGSVPWITKDGLDPGKLPIDGVLRQATQQDERTFRSGVNILRSMHDYGREEAGIFLLGLLVASDDDWERRIVIVEALRSVKTKRCADLLFGELRRIKSSNTTRRYLDVVIKALASMPREHIHDGFSLLAEDKSFSYKMRARFRAVIGIERRSGFDEDGR